MGGALTVAKAAEQLHLCTGFPIVSNHFPLSAPLYSASSFGVDLISYRRRELEKYKRLLLLYARSPLRQFASLLRSVQALHQ